MGLGRVPWCMSTPCPSRCPPSTAGPRPGVVGHRGGGLKQSLWSPPLPTSKKDARCACPRCCEHNAVLTCLFPQDGADHREPAVGRRLVGGLPGHWSGRLPHRRAHSWLPAAAARWVRPAEGHPMPFSCCLPGAEGPGSSSSGWGLPSGRAARPVCALHPCGLCPLGDHGRGLFHRGMGAPFDTFRLPLVPGWARGLSPTSPSLPPVTVVHLYGPSVWAPSSTGWSHTQEEGHRGLWSLPLTDVHILPGSQRYVVMTASDTHQLKDSSHRVTSNPDFGKTIRDLPL